MTPPPHQALCARVKRHGLIAAECAALTGGRPDDDGIAPCDRFDRIDRAAYTHRGLRVLAAGDDFDELRGAIDDVHRSGLQTDSFRIDVHDPARRSPLSSVDLATTLAAEFDGRPDLSMPQHRFIVVVGSEGWTFGEVVAESDASYRRHESKPWTTSSSLDSRFARGLVNLVPDARSVLDPCCGAGSIVVEAASLGLDAFGVDWKPAMVGMTTQNLAHFGYHATVVRADSRSHHQTADAIVTDLPYGHAIDGDEPTIRAILDRAVTLAPQAVIVAPADISTWLDGAGYNDIGVHTVLKRRGFTRWIHTARSSCVSAESPTT